MKTAIWVCKDIKTGELRHFQPNECEPENTGLDYWLDCDRDIMLAWYESATPQFKLTWKLIKLVEE